MLQYNKKINILFLVTKFTILLFIARFIFVITNMPMHICILLVSIGIYINTKNATFNMKVLCSKNEKISYILVSVFIIMFFEIIIYKFFYLKKFININFQYEDIIIQLILFQIFNCFIEEFLFRCNLFEQIKLKISNEDNYKIVISSFIFAIFHIIFLTEKIAIEKVMALFLGTFIVGLCIAYIYSLSKSYIYISIIHFTYNIIQNLIILNFDMNSMVTIDIWIIYTYSSCIFISLALIYKYYFKNKKIR